MPSKLEFLNGQLPPELQRVLETQANPPTFADLSGTPGAGTANTATGRGAIALGAAAVVITNNLVGPNSVVMVVLEDLDTTALYVRRVLPAAGQFTVTTTANATAACKFRWVVIGAF